MRHIISAYTGVKISILNSAAELHKRLASNLGNRSPSQLLGCPRTIALLLEATNPRVSVSGGNIFNANHSVRTQDPESSLVLVSHASLVSQRFD